MDGKCLPEGTGAVRRRLQYLLERIGGNGGQAEELLTEAVAGLQQAVDALRNAEANPGDGGERPSSRPAVTGREERSVVEGYDWPAAVLDFAPLVSVIVDHDLQVIRANRAAAALADQPAEQMHGRRAGHALRCLNALADPRGCGFGPSCGKCKVRETVLDTHATGEARCRVQARLPLRRDGEDGPVDLLVSTAALEDSGRRRVLVFVEDVSEAVRSEASLRAFLEALPESALIMTFDGTVIEANTEVAARLGITREDLLSTNAYALIPEELRESRRQQAEKVLRSGTSVRFVDWRNGRCIENIIAPIPNPGGPVKRLAILGLDITDHQQAQANLRNNEERLKRAQRIARVGDWQWDVVSNQVTWSEENFRLFGLEPSAEPPSFELVRSFVHPDDVATWEGEVREALASGDSLCRDYRAITRDGRLIWIHNEISVERDEQGRPRRMFGTAQDVTDRKQAEEALRQSEARFRALVENANDILYTLALDGTFTYVSPNVTAQLGFEPPEVLGRHYADLVHPEDGSACDAFFQQVIASGKSARDVTYRLRCRNGGWLWHTSNGSALTDDEGNVVSFLGISRDITDKKRQADALRESEARYRQLVELAQEGIWALDASGRTTFVNPRMAQMLGCTVAEMEGRAFYEFMDESQIAAAEACFRKRQEGQSEHHEFEFRRRNGSAFHASLAAAPLRDATGRFAGAFAVVSDITERRQAELDLKRTLEATTDGIWTWNFAADELTFSPRYYTMLGYEPGEFPASFENWLGLMHPDDRDQALAVAEKYLRTGPDVYENEFRLRAKGGEYRWIRTRAKVVERGPDGQAIRMIGNHEDITEHRQAQEQLEISEERLRLAHRATNDVIWDWDIVHDSQMWNPAGATVFGWSDIIRHPQTAAWWTERVHPDDRQRVADGFYAVVHDPSQAQWQDEYRFRKSDGSYAAVLDRGYVMRDERGRAVRMIGAMLDITERKRAEEQLREALLWQETAIAAGNVGFWDWDLRTDTVVYSREWKSQIGYEEHEIGDGFDEWRSRVHPDDLDATLGIVRDAVAQARPSWEAQFRFRHKDGSYRWILAQASVLCDDAGCAVRALGTHVDITERKRAEEELRAAHRRLKALLSVASLTNADTKEVADHILATLIRMTDSQYGFYGFINEDESVMTIHAWSEKAMENCATVDPPLRFPVREAGIWGEAVRRRKPLILNDYQAPHSAKRGLPEGHVTLTTLLVVPHFVKGRIEAVAAVANNADGYTGHDVTQVSSFLAGVQAFVEKARAEETLKASEERYRTVADFTYDWETWIGRDGQMIYCSPAVQRITGYSSEELVRNPALLGQMVHPDDRAAMEHHLLRESSEPADAFSLDYRIVTKDGEERWVSHDCAPVYGDHGEYAGRRGSTRDITDRKQLEEQLRQSQKLEAVGQFAGGVAHDFNNLLTAISGFCELLKAAVAESVDVNHALEGIQEAARQATGITRSLLTFTAKLPSHKQRVDLQELVRKTVHLLGRMMPASIEIVREPAETPPIWLYADGVLLQQVILNLMINARDAMPRGGTLRITVDALAGDAAPRSRLEPVGEDSPPAARFARLTVSDTGTGMPPEILARVFEPFFTTKERGLGTGLGLAIVHGIVQEHRGHIEIDSTRGEGTTFTITLPVLEAERPDAVEDRVAVASRAQGELVLLAEEDWNIRSLVASVLKDAGFEVCQAADGVSLMARFAELADRISLVVLDVDLPRRSGLDCLRDMRTGAANTPAIVFAGGGQVVDEKDLDRHTVLLRKPFSMGDLKQQATQMACPRYRKESEA